MNDDVMIGSNWKKGDKIILKKYIIFEPLEVDLVYTILDIKYSVFIDMYQVKLAYVKSHPYWSEYLDWYDASNFILDIKQERKNKLLKICRI